jgi:hypothetical protein
MAEKPAADIPKPEDNSGAANDDVQFLDHGPGNGLWFSLECFNKSSQNVDAKCKSNPLRCGHHHVKVGQEHVGKFVTINWSTVHTSAYPTDVTAVVAQFFFAVSASSHSKPKRQRIENRTAYTEGNFDVMLCSSVGKRAVSEWNGAFACRDARASGIGKYQGKQVNDTKVWSKKVIETELEGEFEELHQLKQAAEARFAEAYGFAVETHTIWIIQKKSKVASSEQDVTEKGGFDPHIDHFTPSLGHIGTISTPIAFLRQLK